MNEEEELKGSGEVNPDALEAVFAEEIIIEDEDEEILLRRSVYADGEDEGADELDIAFQDDEGYW